MATSETKLERVTRVIGHLNEINMALLILPVTRNSIWFLLFGIPFERALIYHRRLGVIVFALMTAHLAIWWNIWAAARRFVECLTWSDSCSPAIAYGTIAYATVLIMVIFAYYLVRRKNWVTHIIIAS
jgi:hypothetical protein